MTDDRAYLEYIRESIALVTEYAVGGREVFLADLKTQDAVLRRMETLADAASHLSDSLKDRNPDIPWRQIAAFRNVLAHAYSEVRLDVVWTAIERDLPVLKMVIEAELAQLPAS